MSILFISFIITLAVCQQVLAGTLRTSPNTPYLNSTTTFCDYEATCYVSGIEGACVSIGSGCCSGSVTSGLCPGN